MASFKFLTLRLMASFKFLLSVSFILLFIRMILILKNYNDRNRMFFGIKTGVMFDVFKDSFVSKAF